MTATHAPEGGARHGHAAECAGCAELRRAEAAANGRGDLSAAVDQRVLLARHRTAEHGATT